MYFEFEDCYGLTKSHEDEKSRYFRRSDALLSELQASYLSPDGADEPVPTSSGIAVVPLIHQHHPQSSPPTPSTLLLRPIPQRPTFMQEPTEWDTESSTMEEDHDSDFAAGNCYALRPSPSNLAQWVEELRSEGARNPLPEDCNVVLSDSTQLFLKNNSCLNSSSTTSARSIPTTPSLLSLVKPVALRATDVSHNNMM